MSEGDLYGIKVSVSPHVPDHLLVLVGEEKQKDDLHFSRQLSILDLRTGKISGSVHKGEVQRIELSDKNKNMIDDYFNEQERLSRL